MSKLQDLLLSKVPADGTTIGNISLRAVLSETLGRYLGDAEYFAARDALVDAGVVIKGQGRGGSVRRPGNANAPPRKAATQVPALTKPAGRVGAGSEATLLSLVPLDGSTIGNGRLLGLYADALGCEVAQAEYLAVRDPLVAAGKLIKGQGRGGSVRLASPAQKQLPTAKAYSAGAATTPAASKPVKPKKAKRDGKENQVLSYRHKDRRKNNPEVGMVKPENDPAQLKTQWMYDPHIDPALQFDVGRSEVETLIDDALVSGDQQRMRDALLELKRMSQPYLNWAGKAEHTSFEVDTVSLHVHERIDPATILAAVRKAVVEAKAGKAFQPGLFDAPFEKVPLREAIDFYRHDRGWANRLIAGDSLLVMNSLLQKEGMGGQVQMVYMDPPYGIKYGSNFQPFVGNREVKDGKDEDLTREPEMIKAFRDTWELGLHSYLTYLRDRLTLAKDLLHETGSVFVQISDENLHHVREITDEVFGSSNFVSNITAAKTTGATSEGLAGISDYVVWYAKCKDKMKYQQLYFDKVAGQEGATGYSKVVLKTGEMRRLLATERNDPKLLPPGSKIVATGDMTSQRPPGDFPVTFRGATFVPVKGYWKTGTEGFPRLIRAARINATSGGRLSYIRHLDDFPAYPLNNLWTDTVGQNQFGGDKLYVVQTGNRIIERCMLMTTLPGDLVLDPTCGSGTTAFVAENWGRRWITCDTSRVAITLAKQRFATATFDYYRLRYPNEGLKGGFVYKTIPHVMLKSIANNPEIDQIYDEQHPAIDQALANLNAALHKAAVATPFAIAEGSRKAMKLDFKKGEALLEWEVPFEFPEAWPVTAKPAFTVFHTARQTMQRTIDQSIKSHAAQEILYDKPDTDPTRIRISGPFTIEAVPFPSVLSLDQVHAPAEADAAVARSGESWRQHQWRDELLKTGIRGKGGQMVRFAGLEAMPGTRYVHVTGTLTSGERAVVSFGPEHAALEQRQVSLALDEVEKLRPQPKFIIFAAFTFDPEAAKDIDETNWPGLTLLKAQMNTDLLTEDLKKAGRNNQSFWLMGQPEVEVRKLKGGRYEVEVHGFDYFDTKEGKLISGGKAKIAAWMLDTDYDSRSLFPRQVFFPMAGKKDGWNKLRRDLRAELDEEKLAAFHGTVSLPFDAGENRQVAVKIVDDRGIESLKVLQLD